MALRERGNVCAVGKGRTDPVLPSRNMERWRGLILKANVFAGDLTVIAITSIATRKGSVRLVAVGLGDKRTRIIGHDQLR